MVVAGATAAGTGCGGPSAGGGKSLSDGQDPGTIAADPVARTQLREQAIVILLEETTSSRPDCRAMSLEALNRTPGRLKTVLPKALADPNLGVRAVAATAVGRSRLTEQIDNVQPLLVDPSPMVRISALYAMRRCDESFDPTPMSIYLTDNNPRVRAQAAFLIGDLGDPSALGMLTEAARDSMPRASAGEVRLAQLQIAEARVKLGDNTAVDEIRAALYPSRPEDLEATALAAQIIGEVNDKGAIDQLVFLTARIDETKRPMPAEVRLAAAGSLAKLGLPRGSFIASEHVKDTNPAIRAQAAYVFGETGQAANLTPLSQMLEDPDEQVRLSAAYAIVKITDRLSVGPGPAAKGT
ncbi:MAG: HEAT repeat domain-containing protein [Phycisphaeraceae bacterium]|nr:HEAT repeat domain-containing protein [Phycisphaeraceae bacterium]